MLRRMIFVLVVAAVLVAMPATAAFAAKKCEEIAEPNRIGESCVGGEGERGGTIGTAGQESIIFGFDEERGLFIDASQTGGGGDGAGGPGPQGGGGGGGSFDATATSAGTDAQLQGGSGRGGKTVEPDGGGGGQCSIEDNVVVEEHGSECPFIT